MVEIKSRTFRCEEFWFHIPGFIDVVKGSWNTIFVGSNAFQLIKNIQVFRQKVKTWNKREVGKLEENLKQIEKEIDMVQGILMSNQHNVFLQENNVTMFI